MIFSFESRNSKEYLIVGQRDIHSHCKGNVGILGDEGGSIIQNHRRWQGARQLLTDTPIYHHHDDQNHNLTNTLSIIKFLFEDREGIDFSTSLQIGRKFMDFRASPFIFYFLYFLQVHPFCLIWFVIRLWFGLLMLIDGLSIKYTSPWILNVVFSIINPYYSFNIYIYSSFFLALSDRSIDEKLVIFHFSSRNPPSLIIILLHR